MPLPPGLRPGPLWERLTRVRHALLPRAIVAAFGLMLGFAIVALLVFVQISSTPNFCGSCHLMKPYYKSWQNSKHNKIACVECHISPGLTAEVRKKYEALSMVAKYFTATYGTKPWAEVDDAACLRCHERRLLEGRVTFHGVQFDHRPHLTEARRGLHLRCTSCHGQMVQGVHLTVTVSTCALCHFKGQPVDGGLGACRSCHAVPQTVTTAAGTTFDHSQVGRNAMPCTSCHAGLVQGEGVVTRDRCLQCHNQADRLSHFGERDHLHDWHVSKHKIDCQDCHSPIEHGRHPFGRGKPVTAAQTASACTTCHGSGHSPQRDLYSGTGGRGVPPMPSAMFQTGVTCQGCHNTDLSAQVAAFGADDQPTPRTGAMACMSCHGPKYRGIFLAWKQAVDERTAAIRAHMEASAGAMGLEPPAAWEDARHNFQLVARGRGIHNINYAYALLEKAHEQMNTARQSRGLAALAMPWKTFGKDPGKCLNCHQGIEKQAGTFSGRRFAHGPHVLDARMECAECHRTHAQRAPGEVVRYPAENCSSCHHKSLTKADKDVCGRCHGDMLAKRYPTFRGQFEHQAHLDAGETCAGCHVMRGGDPIPPRSKCAECHEGS